MTQRDPIGIIGGGFTGTALAVQLARRGAGPHLVEPLAPGPGLAYGTADPLHLLNVPAKSMSALPDEPSHFLDWLGRRPVAELGPLCLAVGPDAFVPRALYGRYLRELLEATPGITHHAVAATDLLPGPNGFEVAPLGLRLRRVALCLGNPPPRQGPAAPGVVNDPWAPGALDGLEPDAPLLILGTGLTMADMVMTLRLRLGHRGVIHAVSRHGWAPLPHAEPLPAARPAPPLGGEVSAMMRTVRHAARALPWQAGVDGFRAQLQPVWRGLSAKGRARFLRHARTAWNLHRHRLPPVVAARLEAEVAAGTLRLHAARLAGFTGGEAVLRLRGGGEARVAARRLLHCTGPDLGHGLAALPLVKALLARNLLRQDALGLGLEVEPDRLEAAPGLHILGPPTRAVLWEATAVPELRVQAALVAALMTA